MTTPKHVRIERGERSASVVLDHPPLNILDRRAMDEITEAVRELGKEPDVHLVVLRSAGRAFSAGADVGEHLPPGVGALLTSLRRMLLAIDAVPVPTLAAIHGAALGGGLELALAADRRIATADARLGNPEVLLGVIAPAAAVLLPDIVGAGPALHLLTTGAELSAREALAIGLVDRVVAPGELDAAVNAEASLLAARSRSALVATKKAVRFGASQYDLQDRLEAAENLYLSDIATSADGVAGIKAFLGRRR